jgi:hypothetical protein
MKPSPDTSSRSGAHSSEDHEVSLIFDIIDRDILCNPERLMVIDQGTLSRLRDLVGHVEMKLERPLSPDNE